MTDHAWNELLDELRALGGTAENLCLREGPRGRGLFAIDPAKPVELLIPENVLVDVEDVVFENGVFRVGPGSKLGARERAFVEKYEADFSWGAGGRAETESFFESAKDLPEAAREQLTKDLGLGFMFRGVAPERVQHRFLDARRIDYHGRHVVMPIMDLANYGHLTGYDTDSGGVAIKGQFPDEVLIRYARGDPYAIFGGWGFASAEAEAFSVPMSGGMKVGKFVVSTRHGKWKDSDDPWLPELTIVEDQFRFSFLLLGHRNFPRLPKGIFCRVMKNAGYTDVEEAFEFIRQMNALAFLHTLALLDGAEGPMAQVVRKMALLQLQSLAYCFGTRDPKDGGYPFQQ